MTGVREERRAGTTARILAAAREQVAEHGAGMSMRAVAREVGLVSSAVYRYFPTREALLTAMILESYGRLEEALASAVDGTSGGAAPRVSPADGWGALCRATREWARARPHEFQLIYGTPLPGYVAPPETVPAAAAVAAHFLQVGAVAPVEGFGGEVLQGQLADVVGDGLAGDASGAAAVLTEVAALVGFVTLELGGHFVGTADPADALFEAMLARQAGTLGLAERAATSRLRAPSA
jgi:AcrR family transcriptional regulator